MSSQLFRPPYIIQAVLLIVAWFAPHAGGGFLSAVERFGARLAKRKGLAVLLVGLSAVLIRIALLGVLPVPFPRIHDEFSYLLGADTFAHGRLTNPSHPMWIYFDTMQVNQHPTYMSKYPPAQGAFLAVGQLLGHPWIGVVLSVGLMCGAIVWMLQGWLPPRWALVGGVLALLRLGIFGYWMNSYWGGAVAAIGGALVVGALPRILHSHRWLDAGLMGLGAAILANSRPFEGLIFCVPVFAALVIWIWGRRAEIWRKTVPQVILPICAVLAVTLAFMAYYNWRGTGSPLLFPYIVNSRTYMTAPELIWEKPKAPLHYLNPQLESFYNGWSRGTASARRVRSIREAVLLIKSNAMVYIVFFLWPELCVPLLAMSWILADRRVRFLVFQFAFCFLALLLSVWFDPHYAAPFTATMFTLLIQGMRHLRHWSWNGRAIGVGLTRAVVLSAIMLAPFHERYVDFNPDLIHRSNIAAHLSTVPGRHLVIVRYAPSHSPSSEWVYNSADIDDSKIVWAREIPGISLEPLLNYYRGREVWLVEADSPTPHELPYYPATADR